MKEFHNIKCSPILELYTRHRGGREHVAGPHYPDFYSHLDIRHRRGNDCIDECPPDFSIESAEFLPGTYVYGGCVIDHFGHFISEFSHRLLPAINEFPHAKVIYVWRDTKQPLPRFVVELFEYFDISERILLVRRNSIIQHLVCYPQAEFIGSKGVDCNYLSMLREHLERKIYRVPLGNVVFVSRSKMAARFCGESLLNSFFLAFGVRVIHPESLPFNEQLSEYLNASILIFSEGSALHMLQMFGDISAEVFVLKRRDPDFLKNSLLPRVKKLNYLDYRVGQLAPINMRGTLQLSDGLTFLDLMKVTADMSQILGFNNNEMSEWAEANGKGLEDLFNDEIVRWYSHVMKLERTSRPQTRDEIVVGLRRVEFPSSISVDRALSECLSLAD